MLFFFCKRRGFVTLLRLETLFFTNLLEVRIERVFGALKGLTRFRRNANVAIVLYIALIIVVYLGHGVRRVAIFVCSQRFLCGWGIELPERGIAEILGTGSVRNWLYRSMRRNILLPRQPGLLGVADAAIVTIISHVFPL